MRWGSEGAIVVVVVAIVVVAVVDAADAVAVVVAVVVAVAVALALALALVVAAAGVAVAVTAGTGCFGGTAGWGLEEPPGACCIYRLFKKLCTTPLGKPSWGTIQNSQIPCKMQPQNAESGFDGEETIFDQFGLVFAYY